MELPVGYVFLPTDEELVDFLCDKIQGRMDSQTTSLMFEYDLYGDQEPWDIWNRFRDHSRRMKHGGDQDLYFFTKLKKVSINGSRISRKVGSGTWSGAYSETVFASASRISQYSHNNVPIAVKKHFRYENDECPEHHGAWIMHEFSLCDQIETTTSCSNSDQFVVCRLRKKYDDQSAAVTAGNNKKNKKRNSIKFDDHHQIYLQEPTAALLHTNKKMRLSDQNSSDHQVVDLQQHNSEAMPDYCHFESSSSAFGIGSSIACQHTPIILNDLRNNNNNNNNNIIQQKEAAVPTNNDNDDLQYVLPNNWDSKELLEMERLLFSEETNRKESSPPPTTALHDDAAVDEVISEIEKSFFTDQEAINHIDGTDQDLDEAVMMMMNNSTDNFKYNEELNEVITTGTTSLATSSNTADHDHDDHVLEGENDEDIQANELLDMNLSDLDTSFEEYFNANHPSFGTGF